MIVAILRHDTFLLNWIHVLSGALWTGADLFMGFILGPVLRMLDMGARTALIAYLVPRTLLYFPMVSLTAGTAGWFLADWFGFTAPASPMFHLTLISLALVAVMTIIGLGFLLPNKLADLVGASSSLSLTASALSASTESISGLQARRASCKSSLFS
jgi:hypothetical protein